MQKEESYPVVTERGKLAYREGQELTKKDILRERLVDMLGDPGQDIEVKNEDNGSVSRVWDSWRSISTKLGYKSNVVTTYFSRQELYEIEAEAIEVRRKRYSHVLKLLDDALIKRATVDGEVSAIKLAYQKFEGWSEKHTLQGDKNHPFYLSVLDALDEAEKEGRSLPGAVERRAVERNETAGRAQRDLGHDKPLDVEARF